MTDLNLIRDAVLELLGPYGVRRISVFGSFARGDADADSDIDILVLLEDPRRHPLGLLAWVAIEMELAERLGRPVDLVSEAGLSRHLRPYVDSEKVVVYEAA